MLVGIEILRFARDVAYQLQDQSRIGTQSSICRKECVKALRHDDCKRYASTADNLDACGKVSDQMPDNHMYP
jgi:hypothetical protein